MPDAVARISVRGAIREARSNGELRRSALRGQSLEAQSTGQQIELLLVELRRGSSVGSFRAARYEFDGRNSVSQWGTGLIRRRYVGDAALSLQCRSHDAGASNLDYAARAIAVNLGHRAASRVAREICRAARPLDTGRARQGRRNHSRQAQQQGAQCGKATQHWVGPVLGSKAVTANRHEKAKRDRRDVARGSRSRLDGFRLLRLPAASGQRGRSVTIPSPWILPAAPPSAPHWRVSPTAIDRRLTRS